MFRTERALTDIAESEEIREDGGEEEDAKTDDKASNSKQDSHIQAPELHQVVLRGDTELLTELIQSGADINVLDEMGWPPLHTAIRANKTACAAILIKSGAGEFYYNKQKEDYLKRLESSKKSRKISYWR